MAITLETVARNAANDGVVDLCDVGGTGKLKIRESAVVLAEFDLAATAFGASATGSATANSLPLATTGLAAGTADNYQVTQNDDTLLWAGVASGTGGGGDLELDNPVIAVSQAVNITAWTHAQPAT